MFTASYGIFTIWLDSALRTAACQWIDFRNVFWTQNVISEKPLCDIQMNVFESPDEAVLSKHPAGR